MVNIVFFSGGLDSTLMALNLLRSKEYIVLVNFDSSKIGGETQRVIEKVRMKKILTKFRTEFGENSFELRIFTFDGEMFNCIQPKFWGAIFPCVCKTGDKAYYGVIQHSSFWHIREKFEKAFHAVCTLQDKKVELLYPLEWSLKSQIKKELKKYGYLDLAIHSNDSLENNRVNV